MTVTLRAIFTLIAILSAFGVNVASNFAPINGQTVGGISNTVFGEVLITPAGYAFAIWGLIYLGVFTFGIYQVLPDQRRSPRLDHLRWPMMIASAAQILWIFVFLSFQFVWSLIAMLIIWGALMVGYFRWRQDSHTPTKAERWCVQTPWSIYLGWITVATIVNVALTLFSLNWSGGPFSPIAWTIGLIFVAMIVAMIVIKQQQDIAFVGVFMWALVAIAVRHWSISSLGLSALGAAVVLGIWSGYLTLFRPTLSAKIKTP